MNRRYLWLERLLILNFDLILAQYDDLDALQKDFLLLCKNTQTYNEDGSLIYEDSIVLESVFVSARARLEADTTSSSGVGDGGGGEDSNAPSTQGDTSVPNLDETGETVESGASGSRASSVAGDGGGGGGRGRMQNLSSPLSCVLTSVS